MLEEVPTNYDSCRNLTNQNTDMVAVGSSVWYMLRGGGEVWGEAGSGGRLQERG